MYSIGMLTKNDLSQIRKVLREEIGNEIEAAKTDIQSDITMSRMRIQAEIGELKDRIKNLEIRLTKMHKELKEEIKMVSHVLDKENIQTSRRVTKIEHHIGLPQAQ